MGELGNSAGNGNGELMEQIGTITWALGRVRGQVGGWSWYVRGF